MVTFTDTAKQKVLAFIEANPNKEFQVLRIAIPNFGAQGYNYQFFLDEKKNQKADDVVLDVSGFTTVIDAQSAEKLKGATVDWAETVTGAGFKVDNPNKPQANLDTPIAQRIRDLLESEINPGVASHGGHVELLDVQGARAFVKMSGGCQGCGMSAVTLKQGIETRIKEVAPEILEVVDSTDHAGGTNPYYSA